MHPNKHFTIAAQSFDILGPIGHFNRTPLAGMRTGIPLPVGAYCIVADKTGERTTVRVLRMQLSENTPKYIGIYRVYLPQPHGLVYCTPTFIAKVPSQLGLMFSVQYYYPSMHGVFRFFFISTASSSQPPLCDRTDLHSGTDTEAQLLICRRRRHLKYLNAEYSILHTHEVHANPNPRGSAGANFPPR